MLIAKNSIIKKQFKRNSDYVLMASQGAVANDLLFLGIIFHKNTCWNHLNSLLNVTIVRTYGAEKQVSCTKYCTSNNRLCNVFVELEECVYLTYIWCVIIINVALLSNGSYFFASSVYRKTFLIKVCFWKFWHYTMQL